MTAALQIPSVGLLGECMIELREESDGRLRRGYGGDVLNTAVYLSRLLGDAAQVRFVSIMGDDPFSDQIIDAWAAEGIVCDAIGRKPRANPGLYVIQTDSVGERSFHYWRQHSPARELMAAQWSSFTDKAFQSSWIYFSGITLAILDDTDRERLLSRLQAARDQGSKIVFDGNFRPILWDNPASAAIWHDRVWRVCSMALAGYEDEAQLYGDRSPEETFARLNGYGTPEIVVKQGDGSILLGTQSQREIITVQQVSEVVDTTAAGDSFNAGYLSGRIRGLGEVESVQIGADLAATVIQHTGAIIPLLAMPEA